MSDTYKLMRFFQHQPSEILATGLTLAEVQAHCQSPETSSTTCQSREAKARTRQLGPWFDGYFKE